MSRVRLRIHGRVQGVFFRAWTAQEAASRNLSGWVRNRSDGTVEALFAGDEAAVEAMIEACRQGPPAARVTRIERLPVEEPVEPGFHQLPSA